MTNPLKSLIVFACVVFLFTGCKNPVAPQNKTASFHFAPESYQMHIGTLKDKDVALKKDPYGKDFTGFHATSALPETPDFNSVLTFVTDFTLPESMKDKPLLLFIPTVAYSMEIRINQFLVYACGIMEADHTLEKFFSEREFISPKILNPEGPNRLIIQIRPLKNTVILPEIFFGEHKDIAYVTLWHNLRNHGLLTGFFLLSFFFFFMFFMLWIGGGFKNNGHLYFALTCLFLGGGYLYMIVANASISGLWTWKLSSFCFSVSIITALFYFLDFINAKKNIPFKIAIFDSTLPEMDGYEATAIIRDTTSKVRNHHIRVIALTANTSDENKDKCLRAGMDGFIPKPIKIDALKTLVQDILDHKSKS